VIGRRKAIYLTTTLITVVTAMTVCVLVYTLRTGESYAYMMGHFPAPWGNEIRIGVMETLMMTVFCFVMLFSFVGGMLPSIREIESTKYNIYCILVDLLLLGLLGGIPALGGHLLVDVALHAQAVAQGAVEGPLHVAGGGLDGAVHVQVADALGGQEQVFHNHLIIHAVSLLPRF
jgi:hypothetical protein